MAGWDKYCYCTNCSRPYCESETRTGEFVVTQLSDGGVHAIHCVSCSDSIIRPQKTIGLLITGIATFCVAAVALGFVVLMNDAKMRDLFFICLPIGGLCLWVNHQQKSRYKTIYDRWVMQHGTDPDKWPAAAKLE